jgi:localization factor PodJL
VQANQEEAVVWLDRAAKAGLAPAQFRLGGMYEKGYGVKKDPARARELYTRAANAGNARAMHNLAVIYAEGVDGKPDFTAAVQWFRKAAARGVADSQFNLGVLYARGIGVDNNPAESFKWFALAAQQGDRDAAQKRDEIAKKLDPPALEAARRAVQSWTSELQPDDATTVKTPPGGWDATGSSTSAPAAAKPKRTSTGQKPPKAAAL